MEFEQLLKLMSKPEFYAHKPSKVEVVQTHISAVFIADELVYKVKKPVNFGFVDFSTLEKRKFFCEKEVELNRRLCPDVYLGVEPIRIDDTIVEYAVVMKRLPVDKSLKNLIRRGEVQKRHIEKVVKRIAEFHKKAYTSERISQFGKVKNFRRNTDENFEQTQEYVGITIDRDTYEFIKSRTDEFYRKFGVLIDERAEKGFVRECHGDLHTEHIIIDEDKVYIFDCIEFNERFRFIDVACDFAFFLMDLDFLGRSDLSHYAQELYVLETGDEEALKLFPLFKSYRAYVRGKVNSFMFSDPNIKDKDTIKKTAFQYFKLARSYLESEF